MRRPQGYATIIDPDRPLGEYDTVSCCHCGRIVFTKPGSVSTVYLIQRRVGDALIWQEEPGAACWSCQKPVCLRCYDHGACRPLERWLEQQEQPTFHP